MIRSMTGCGVATTEAAGTQFAVEVRSVNGRHFKANLRMPDELLALEADLEMAVAKRISRGSVTMTVRFSATGSRSAVRLNVQTLHAYLRQLEEGLGKEAVARVDPGALLTLPGVIAGDGVDPLVETARKVLPVLLEDACSRLLEMRAREGEVLASELKAHGLKISAALERIAVRAPSVVEQYRDRLRVRVQSLLNEVGATIQDGDLVREVALFAERSDIAEEVSRLQGHMVQYQELLDPSRVEPVGRTLDFLSQEMLREANTIASKSSDSETTRAVVEMKTAIDRIKEQSQNAE